MFPFVLAFVRLSKSSSTEDDGDVVSVGVRVAGVRFERARREWTVSAVADSIKSIASSRILRRTALGSTTHAPEVNTCPYGAIKKSEKDAIQLCALE